MLTNPVDPPSGGEDTYSLSPEENAVVSRAKEIIENTHKPEPLTDDERQAIRAFLQRAETRLSTYQRVAGVFLNGAGLLVLLPGLARDSVYTTLSFALTSTTYFPKLILIPWVFAVAIPLYAFVALLRDIVEFYFSPRFLQVDPMRITHFSLAGITLPYDEGREPKAQVIAAKVIDSSYRNFILGGTSEKTIKKAHKDSKGGNAAFPLRRAIMKIVDKRTLELTNADHIGVAFSLGGSLDLSLVGEVARMEASVCRHVLQLRKLVLRYSKALIIFVWTTLIMVLVGSLLDVKSAWPSEEERSHLEVLEVTGHDWMSDPYSRETWLMNRPNQVTRYLTW